MTPDQKKLLNSSLHGMNPWLDSFPTGEEAKTSMWLPQYCSPDNSHGSHLCTYTPWPNPKVGNERLDKEGKVMIQGTQLFAHISAQGINTTQAQLLVLVLLKINLLMT